jgi:plastocyanin
MMKFIQKRHIKNTIFLLVSLFIAGLAQASDLTVEVTNAQGKPLKNAVVYLVGEKSSEQNKAPIVDIEQKGKQFNPLVTVVQTGASINFPNHDRVRHHVYSFSPAKKFELKLYSGVPTNPVIFDQAGTVVLGCNIHDNMLAFVYIVNTPYFAQTDASGIATLTNTPDGAYQLKVWHYALQKENIPVEQAVDVKPNQSKLIVKLDINEVAIVPSR